MASRPMGATIRRIERLFHRGSVAGLSEVQLLERFVLRHDDDAFEALVERHGPMVLGICRQWLRDPGDVEDAFQATFLVLVRKAGSLRHRELLGNWLYGVAYRVALRARADRARRRSRETSDVEDLADPRNPESAESRPWLHEEVSRLPDKYRAPIVLCYLEGRTHEEAAEQLRWPVGTVKGRLSRARALLHSRLSRRGLAPSVGLLTAVLSRDASAAIPATLMESTVRAASVLAVGKGVAAGLISVQVITLIEGVCHTMFLSKLKLLTASFVVAGLVTASAGVLARQTPGEGGGKREDRVLSTAGPNDPPKIADPFERSYSPVETSVTKSMFNQKNPPSDQDRIAQYGRAIDRIETETRRDGPRVRADLARKAIELIGSLRKNGQDVTPETEYEWSVRLLEAERLASDKKSDRVAAAEAHLARMKTAMEQSIRQLNEGTETDLSALESQFRYQEAVQGLMDAKAGRLVETPGANWWHYPQFRDHAEFDDWSRLGASPSAPKPVMAEGRATARAGVSSGRGGGGSGGFGPARGSGPGVVDPARRRIMIAEMAPRVAAEDPSPQTKAIVKKLDVPVSMSFANEAPLEDVLKYIKSATTGANDNGIPIYVDPIGLREAERTMTAPVTLDLEGVPLKTTLRLMLKQIGLAYCVKDGLLIISCPDGIYNELEEAVSGAVDSNPRPE
jgi:RNA polymerase sigma factor (sigma-70 family)